MPELGCPQCDLLALSSSKGPAVSPDRLHFVSQTRSGPLGLPEPATCLPGLQMDKFNCIDDRDLHLLEEAMQSQGSSSRAQDSFMRRVQLDRQPRGLPDDERLPLLGHSYR